jgi:NADPH-dependent curcumin reductase CurA
MKMLNRKIILKNRPNGYLSENDFETTEEEFPLFRDGEVLIETKYLSVDPYMRERMTPMKSYMAAFELGEAITGTLVAVVKESKNPDFAPGEAVTGFLKWQDYQAVDGKTLRKLTHKPDQPDQGPARLPVPVLARRGRPADGDIHRLHRPDQPPAGPAAGLRVPRGRAQDDLLL